MTTAPQVLDVPLPTHTASALVWGPDDGPLLLALHGFPDTAWTWRRLAPLLAEDGWRVVAPHLRGYAPSGLASDGCYHPAALMADAVALHARLGGDERAVLVGHDWGAIAGNGLAAHPDSPYRRVVTLAVPPLPTMHRTPPRLLLRQARNSWYIGFNQLPVLAERALPRLVRKLWHDWSPGYDATEDVGHVLAALDASERRGAALAYYRSLRLPWRVPPAYRHWASTWTDAPRVPLLYLHGADDGCLHAGLVAPLVERLDAALPPGSRAAMVPAAGHFLQVEQPAAVADLVRDFLGPAPA